MASIAAVGAAFPNPVAGPTPGPGPAALSTSSVPGWFTFHGSENRTGYSPQDGPSSGAILWIECPSSQPVQVAPVSDGRLAYVADSLGTVYALSLGESGAVAWSRALGTTPTSADLAAGRLVLGGSDGSVYALSASTGAVLWQRAVGGAVAQAVSVENGTVALGTGAGTVVALNLATGTELWSTPLGAPLNAALAWDGRAFYAATSAGGVFALAPNGAVLWRASVGASVVSSPVVAYGQVYVADTGANVTALSAATGAIAWRFSDARLHSGDAIEETPAATESRLYVQTDQGFLYGLDRATGHVLWSRSTPPTGYAVVSSPVATPAGVYFVDATGLLDDLAPASGALVWQSGFAGAVSYSSPAVVNGTLVVGTDTGCVYAFGSVGGPPLWPVSGTVTDARGGAIPGAIVSIAGDVAAADSEGRFVLRIPNGTYSLEAGAAGYVPVSVPLVVRGAVSGLHVVLRPVPLFVVSGEILDARSGRGLSGVVLTVTGLDGYTAQTASDSAGRFRLLAPSGIDYLAAGPPPGYQGFAGPISVGPGGAGGLRVALVPTALSSPAGDPLGADVWLPALAIGLSAAFLGAHELRRRRVAAGLPPRLLSAFARFVAMRALLVPGQIVGVLTVLFVFGTFLPAAAQHGNPCSIAAGACTSCSWSDVGCVLLAFFRGYGLFVTNLFTGRWGTAGFGNLREPAVLFLGWWLPDSLELAAVALAISALVAYPVGLRAGWRPTGPFDTATRYGSLAGLLVPSFLVILALLFVLYTPFISAFGDAPYGTIPSLLWFNAHGGVPAWIGIAYNTEPTGFPLVDGALHGAWAFEAVTLAKTLLQALAIAVVYVAIFLRYARTVVAESARAPFVTAARARGVPERRLLWGHVGRRVLPLYALVFGLTLPIYLGTQALAEAMFNDTGVGTLLLGEMTGVAGNRFGFGGVGALAPGNFYQVTIFLLLVVVLIGSLAADVLARYLDPRLRERVA